MEAAEVFFFVSFLKLAKIEMPARMMMEMSSANKDESRIALVSLRV